MRVYDRIRLDDPTGKLADDATLALGNAYFAVGKFMKVMPVDYRRVLEQQKLQAAEVLAQAEQLARH